MNKKHVSILWLTVTHEGFMYNFNFHFWLRQFPPGDKHKQWGQYQTNRKNNHFDRQNDHLLVKLTKSLFEPFNTNAVTCPKINTWQERQLRGSQLLHERLNTATVQLSSLLPLQLDNLFRSSALYLYSFILLVLFCVNHHNPQYLANPSDANGRNVVSLSFRVLFTQSLRTFMYVGKM